MRFICDLAALRFGCRSRRLKIGGRWAVGEGRRCERGGASGEMRGRVLGADWKNASSALHLLVSRVSCLHAKWADVGQGHGVKRGDFGIVKKCRVIGDQ